MEQLKLTGKALYGVSFVTFFYYFGYQFYKHIFDQYGLEIPVEEIIPTQEILITGTYFLLLPCLIGTLIISKHDFIHALKASILLMMNKSEISVNTQPVKCHIEGIYHTHFRGISNSVYAKLLDCKTEKDINFPKTGDHWIINYKQFNENFVLVWPVNSPNNKSYEDTSIREQLVKTKFHESIGDDFRTELFRLLFSVYILAILCFAFNGLITLGELNLKAFVTYTVSALLVAFIPSYLVRALLRSSLISLFLGFAALTTLIFISSIFFPIFVDKHFATSKISFKKTNGETLSTNLLFENTNILLIYDVKNEKSYNIPKRNIEYIQYEPKK